MRKSTKKTKSRFITKSKRGLEKANIILNNKKFTENKVLKSKVNKLIKITNKIKSINKKLDVLVDKRIPLHYERNNVTRSIFLQYEHLEKLSKLRYTCHFCKKKYQPKIKSNNSKYCSEECMVETRNKRHRDKKAPIIRKRKKEILNRKIKERERVEKLLIKRLSKIKNIKQQLNKERKEV